MKGKIIYFSHTTGWGSITYGNSLARFHTSNVLSGQNQVIAVGRFVSFDVMNYKGLLQATNVILLNRRRRKKPLNSRLNGIVKYNYENWEEIEKIIDDNLTTKEVKSVIHQPLNMISDGSKYELIDPKYMALAVFEKKIKLVSLSKDGRYSFMDEGQKYHNIIYPTRFEEASLSIGIEEFEDLINSLTASENDFQKFFERNPGFILNNEYKKAHPHIILAKEKGEKLIPDFVLEPVNQNTFCDLLELKLPTANIFVMKKNREHFSSAVTEAAAQLRVYNKYFNETSNRNKFRQIYPHLNIYRPKMFLIIGRQNNQDETIKRDIQSEHPQLIINNFDDLLARMKWKKERLEHKNKLF